MTKQIFQNRWFIWTLTIIIIVGFSVWGFAEYSNVEMNNGSVGSEVVLNRNRVSVQNDISDWQTYRNEEFGFEFKYPSDFQLEDSSAEKLSGNDVFLEIKKDNNTRFIIAKNFAGDYVGVGSAFNKLLGIDINKNGVNIINESNNPLFHVFNALSATSTITVENSQLRVKGIIVSNGTDNVGIRSNYADDDSKLLDQILSTFKFIK